MGVEENRKTKKILNITLASTNARFSGFHHDFLAFLSRGQVAGRLANLLQDRDYIVYKMRHCDEASGSLNRSAHLVPTSDVVGNIAELTEDKGQVLTVQYYKVK